MQYTLSQRLLASFATIGRALVPSGQVEKMPVKLRLIVNGARQQTPLQQRLANRRRLRLV